MDLKDLFAAHVAAGLAHRIERPDVIANRAYELADAMLRERARRTRRDAEEHVDFESAEAFEWVSPAEGLWSDDSMPDEDFFRPSQGLLDEPAPWSDREGLELDPSWLDRENDPRWELEPKWAAPPPSERPGLRRIAPSVVDDEKKRRPA
jgi:hypothetical protein